MVSDQPIDLVQMVQKEENLPEVDFFPADQLIVPEGLEVKLWASLLFSTTQPIWTSIIREESGSQKGETTVD